MSGEYIDTRAKEPEAVAVLRRDDAELVSALQLDFAARQAFEELCDRYMPVLWTGASKVPGLDHHEKEDVCQTVLMKVWVTRLHGFDPTKPLAPFLSAFARNIAVMLLRKKCRRLAQPFPENLAEKSAPESPEWLIDELVSDLNQIDRRLVELQYQEDFKTQTIADKMNMKAGDVSRRLYRIRQKLKPTLEHLRRQGTLPSRAPRPKRDWHTDYVDELIRVVDDESNRKRILGSFSGNHAVLVGIPQGKDSPGIIVRVEGDHADGVIKQLTVNGKTYPISVEFGLEIPQLL
jgi:RNA polymerase sigma factor (sigma-70 family)